MNEAANQLRPSLTFASDELLLDAALTEERRLVIAQIRERMKDDGGFEGENLDRILDELLDHS